MPRLRSISFKNELGDKLNKCDHERAELLEILWVKYGKKTKSKKSKSQKEENF